MYSVFIEFVNYSTKNSNSECEGKKTTIRRYLVVTSSPERISSIFNIWKWNSTFFAFSIIIEGSTENVVQFIMPLKSISNKNLGFVVQKMYF